MLRVSFPSYDAEVRSLKGYLSKVGLKLLMIILLQKLLCFMLFYDISIIALNVFLICCI